MNPYAADDTPTGPILVPTNAMPIVKPLPPKLAWAMAELRPHLELVSARMRALQSEIERVAGDLDALRRQFDVEAERAQWIEGYLP